ncbi:MAG: ABC transporter permease [bacterium]
MKAFFTHFSFEFHKGLRDPSLLLMNYLFPLAFYLVISLLMVQLNPYFRANIIPAMIIFVALTSLVLGLPNPLVSSREAGIFRTYRVNSVPTLNMLLIPALATSIHTLVASLLVTFTAPLLFQAPLPSNWGGFLVFLLLTIFLMAGLGVLIGTISFNTRMTILWSQLVFLPSIMIGGLMIPRSALKGFLARIGGLWPSTYSMELYNSLAGGSGPSRTIWLSIGVLLLGGLLAFFLARLLFSWDSQNRSRKASSWIALLILVPFLVGMFLY